MSTEVIVAVIAAAALGIPAVASYLISRQSSTDARKNIDRDIEIIRKLQPGSSEAVKLEKHISWSIDELVSQERRRAMLAANRRFIWLLLLLLLLILMQALTIWRQHGVWEPIRNLVEWTYWSFYVVYIIALFMVATLALRISIDALRHGVRMGWLKVQAGMLRLRLLKGRLVGWKNKRELGTLQQRLGIVESDFAVRHAYIDYQLAFHDEHKIELIVRIGQEEWDRRRADLMSAKAAAKDLQAELMSIKEDLGDHDERDAASRPTAGSPDTGSSPASQQDLPDRP